MPDPDVSRRRFLGWWAGTIAALGSAFVAIPLVGTLVAPLRPKSREGFVDVGDVTGLKTGEPVAFPFTDKVLDAYIQEQVPRMVWVVKYADRGVVAYSPVCPHLGCEFFWDAPRKLFVCPCHGSEWNIDGAIVRGPTPRSMDTLPSRVKNGRLSVQWERFETGTPKKIVIES